MSETSPNAFNLAGIVIDVLLSVAIFLLFTFFIIPDHTIFHDPTSTFLLSAYTSIVMGCFAFFFLTLFRVTLVDQLRNKEMSNELLRGLAVTLQYKQRA